MGCISRILDHPDPPVSSIGNEEAVSLIDEYTADITEGGIQSISAVAPDSREPGAGECRDDSVGGYASNPVVARIGNKHPAEHIQGNAFRTVEGGLSCLAAITRKPLISCPRYCHNDSGCHKNPPDLMIAGVCYQEVSTGGHRNSCRPVEICLSSRPAVATESGNSISSHGLNHTRSTVNPANPMVEFVGEVEVTS